MAAALLLPVLWAHARCVAPTNFYGYDEWTVLSLVSRGVIDIPYANRPLALLWALPAPLIEANSFAPFVTLRWVYLWLAALLVCWISLRIAPGRPLLAFLAGVVVVVWSPSDYARLTVVEGVLYAGITLGMLLSLALFVESWTRRSVPLLVAASALALVSGRCYEATLLVLVGSPALLLAAAARPWRALLRWVLVYEAWILFGLALAVAPLMVPSGGSAYQDSYGLDVQPRAVLGRLAQQYGLHFGALVHPSLAEMQAHWIPVLVAVGVFLAAGLAWWRLVKPADEPRGDLRILVAAAVLLTGAGYVVQLVTGRVPGAWRAQFLSAPGAGWLLAGVALALGERLRRRGELLTLVLFAWLVAVGTARVAGMQQRWEGASFYALQTRLLGELVASVQDTQPHTLVMLLDESRSWRASFSFQHAVEYLYRGNAIGIVVGLPPAMLPAFFTPQGVVSEPIPVVRDAWRSPVQLFRHDQIVVVRRSREGPCQVLDEWPPEMPPLPAGATYAPRARLRAASQAIPQRHALGSLGPARVQGPS